MMERPQSVGVEVLYHVADGVALVTLNRPAKRNAIDGAVAAALDWIVRTLEADATVNAAVLASCSDRFFSAGADLAEVAAGRGHTLMSKAGGFAGFVDARRDKPWIAAVRGAALGGGTELALACDMIVASEDAVFGLPEVTRGLVAAANGVWRLPRALPRAVALELIATGEPIAARRAATFGMVNHLSADAVAEAVALAGRIAANAPIAVRHSLAIARRADESGADELRAATFQAMMAAGQSADAREGAAAFLEKRTPVWQGR